MTIEVWIRNPYNYAREAVEVGAHLIAWDRGVLVGKKIDPIVHAGLYWGTAYPWRALAIGVQGTAEYRIGDELDRPTAVYPTWEFGESIALLEEMIENPVGEDKELCEDTTIPGDERPVLGQEHRIVITNLPDMKLGPGRQIIAKLKELYEENPGVIFHLHGLYGFRTMFGADLPSVDVDPRTDAQKGNVILPMGKKMRYEQAAQYPNWVKIVGMTPVELALPQMRCKYNILSAQWAGANFNSVRNFKMTAPKPIDIDTESSDSAYDPGETVSHMTTHKKALPGDKHSCNTCSLQDQCKHFREGAVCTLPNAEPKELATFFKSRDSGTIMEGLSTLAAANARRLDRGMKTEETLGDIDPEVTKLIGQLFKMGVDMAKLMDPDLRGGAKVQVNVGVGGGQAQVAGGTMNPRQLVASVIREFELNGISREQVTPDMVKGAIEAMRPPESVQSDVRVIEGTL